MWFGSDVRARSARLRWTICGLVCWFVALAPCGSASASSFSRLRWQHPYRIDSPASSQTAGLTSVACPTTRLCVATDESGNVLTSTNPLAGVRGWSSALVDPGGRLSSLSCPSASFCAAVDETSRVFTTGDPAAGATAWSSTTIEGATDGFSAISCPSTALCVAVDYAGDVATSTDPLSGSAAWHVVRVDDGSCPASGPGCDGVGSYSLDAIACPAVSLCVAANWSGDLLVSTDPGLAAASWSIVQVQGRSICEIGGVCAPAHITHISCPSTSWCLADSAAQVLRSMNPVGDSAAWQPLGVAPYAGFAQISCPFTSLCLAETGSPGEPNVIGDPLMHGSWTDLQADGTRQLDSISCPSALLCVAVDESGYVLVGRSKPPRQAHRLVRRCCRTPRPVCRRTRGL